MKKLLVTLSVAGLFLAAVSGVVADDKVKTIKGEAQCAKCSLKKADACTDVVVVKEEGKDVTYFLAKNDHTKGFHKKICQGKLKVEAKGTVTEKDGKKQFAATEPIKEVQ